MRVQRRKPDAPVGLRAVRVPLLLLVVPRLYQKNHLYGLASGWPQAAGTSRERREKHDQTKQHRRCGANPE